MIKRSIMMIALCAAIFGAVQAQAQTRQLYDPSEPGSVLVFPKFVRGTVGTNLPATEIEVSAHCPTAELAAGGGFCGLAGSSTTNAIRMRGHWVCPGSFGTQVCRETDFNISTTIEGTVTFNTEGLQPPANLGTVRVPPPPCNSGYLILWAIDTSGRPIKFDGLVGDAVVRWNNHAAGSYNAIAIQADPALATNARILGTTSATSALPFDGLAGHYAAVTGTVLSTIKYDTDAGSTASPDGPSTTSLTLLTLDLLSNRPNYTVFSDLNFYDQTEFLWSTATFYTCWQEIPISSIDPGLVRQNMSRKGFFYSVDAVKVPNFGVVDTAGPVTQLGLIDTVECQGAAVCPAETIPVTPTNNPAVVNHYMNPTFDDSVPVPTLYVP